MCGKVKVYIYFAYKTMLTYVPEIFSFGFQTPLSAQVRSTLTEDHFAVNFILTIYFPLDV